MSGYAILEYKPDLVARVSVKRKNAKANLNKGALIQAPAWAELTSYTANINVVRHSNGQLMRCIVSGTSLASEPTFSSTALIAESGGPSWAALGRVSRLNADGYEIPIITADQTAPAGSAIRSLYSSSVGGKLLTATIVGGSGYTNGTYTNVPLTGGVGSDAVALSITVSGGAVTAVTTPKSGTGSGYLVGNILSADAANLGGTGSGFTYTVFSTLQPADLASPSITNLNSFGVEATATPTIRGMVFNDGGTSNPIQFGEFVFGFMTDDPKPAIVITGASSGTKVVINVDGYEIQENPTVFSGSGTSYFKCDWSGVRKLREYIVTVANSTQVRGISLLSQSVLIPLPEAKLKGVYIGDSYGNTVSTYTLGMLKTLSSDVFNRVGILAIRQLHIGGTGYLVGKTSNDNNTTATKYNCLALLSNNQHTYFNDAVSVVFAHGLNDISQTAATVAANALDCWRLARINFPDAIISIFGPWSENSGPGATTLALDTELLATFNSWSDNKSFYHSVAQDQAGSWTTGTGKWGATTGTGNADFYVGADGDHSSFIGVEYLTKRMSEYIESDLNYFGL